MYCQTASPQNKTKQKIHDMRKIILFEPFLCHLSTQLGATSKVPSQLYERHWYKTFQLAAQGFLPQPFNWDGILPSTGPIFLKLGAGMKRGISSKTSPRVTETPRSILHYCLWSPLAILVPIGINRAKKNGFLSPYLSF